MKKLQRKRKGFTLIELVVVIVIIAILAAVALLSFGNFSKTANDSRIKSEHSQLITAGNMWRATQPDPTAIPTIENCKSFMETSKPLAEFDGEIAHKIADGTLTSTFSTGTLTYNFKAVDVEDDDETPPIEGDGNTTP